MKLCAYFVWHIDVLMTFKFRLGCEFGFYYEMWFTYHCSSFLFAPAEQVLINPEFFDTSAHLQDPHCYQLKLIYLSQIPFSLSCQLALPEPTPTTCQKEPLSYAAHGKKKVGNLLLTSSFAYHRWLQCWTVNKQQKQYLIFV